LGSQDIHVSTSEDIVPEYAPPTSDLVDATTSNTKFTTENDLGLLEAKCASSSSNVPITSGDPPTAIVAVAMNTSSQKATMTMDIHQGDTDSNEDVFFSSEVKLGDCIDLEGNSIDDPDFVGSYAAEIYENHRKREQDKKMKPNCNYLRDIQNEVQEHVSTMVIFCHVPKIVNLTET
jgi:hypothetical protein